jgi:hypothetical protein
MRARIVIPSLLFSLTLATGCHHEATTASSGTATSSEVKSAAASNLTPEQLGELGGQIRKAPADAPRLLAEHNLTEAQFEAAIRQVTENPEASKRYTAAFRNVK